MNNVYKLETSNTCDFQLVPLTLFEAKSIDPLELYCKDGIHIHLIFGKIHDRIVKSYVATKLNGESFIFDETYYGSFPTYQKAFHAVTEYLKNL